MNLQTALIALGVLLVAGIYLFSRWQERRGGKKEAKTKRSRSEMSEPSFSRDEPGLVKGVVQDLDADLEGAEVVGEVEPPPPDWDALEQEMARPIQPEPVSPDLAGDEQPVPISGESVESAPPREAEAEPSQPTESAPAEVPPDASEDTSGEAGQSEGADAAPEDEIPVLEARVDEADVTADPPTADSDKEDAVTLAAEAEQSGEDPLAAPQDSETPQTDDLAPEAEDDAALGIFRINGAWDVFKNKDASKGTIYFNVDNRHKLGTDIAPADIASQTGYVGMTGTLFSDVGSVVVDLNYQHRINNNQGGFIVGRFDPNDYVFVSGYANPWTSFQTY